MWTPKWNLFLSLALSMNQNQIKLWIIGLIKNRSDISVTEPDLQVTLKKKFIIQYCLYYFYSFHVPVPIMIHEHINIWSLHVSFISVISG